VYDRWLHPTVHVRCRDLYDRNQAEVRSSLHVLEREMPERFLKFDPSKADARALMIAQGFTPQSDRKTLVLIGVPARGKSRIMWAVITQFFDILREETGAERWVDYFTFADLVSESDRTMLNRFKLSKHAFLDNLGCVESYGRERAGLQQVIRARIERGENWTFLTIDSLRFDDGLETLLKGRAIVHYLDQ
jgi:hypothetical protein